MAKIPKLKKLKLKKKIKDDEPKRPKEKLSKRLKRFYRNNRIYCILMGISLASIVLIILALFAHFIHQNTSNSYGNRLEDIKNYPVEDNINESKTKTEESDMVEKVTVELKGKIIWFTIKVKDDASLEDMQNVGTSTLQYFSPENLGYYDIHYLIERNNKKGYFGDKSASASAITWAKYNLDEDETNE